MKFTTASTKEVFHKVRCLWRTKNHASEKKTFG